ncbi:UDP-N-acetylglucosamine 2-epimerase (non-hydrolysing)/GDP/UDP-N,N'-diacetylbacillosamine 2-epimerase (hydrolysing) [Neorhodopirellula lusitana]|uniref:UDP-N-acetylglucosamine 2-epimerase (Non-hydrolysing)/GDP/UDP-N,N'-diacetylbacillosamine 2-epimerase (Hydrolysing) n=1 Tax=Neorhodopirellula lusitana TaxID=445327 RepID=A0ABY1PU82_9BACT|nr:UDP-N-acetylglucosamine 2-epimerase [Neorhodopirellula lusitana]SMP47682.1 UDP-N-acetylglucosamine 2-epimerase (non-hydrolysing)/GDP/UDP-N,N'-diacetylbacillosamine 2-epimerase (hydrolysing) [Neorhodopirellula lusitana]
MNKPLPNFRSKIAIVTVARSDFGIYLPVLRRLQKTAWADLQIVAGAAHLSQRHGHTVDWIASEGFTVSAEVPITDNTNDARGVARGSAEATLGFADAFEKLQPDLIVLLGDRFEMHAAAVAAVPFAIPITHLHGGETTQGAIDESYRHSLTKMSHLHFASTAAYANRIIQMGENPDNVVVSGAPGLDHLETFQPMSVADLETRLSLSLRVAPLAVTFHPETLSNRTAEQQLQPLLEVLASSPHPAVISQPNADPGNSAILEALQAFASDHSERVRLVSNLGTQAYFSLLHHAAAMVGNSSSGIIEAASFELPVVNIGDRQKGRLHGENVINCGYGQTDIESALRLACSHAFQSKLNGMTNPYGNGTASKLIVDELESRLRSGLSVRKPFHDMPGYVKTIGKVA